MKKNIYFFSPFHIFKVYVFITDQSHQPITYNKTTIQNLLMKHSVVCHKVSISPTFYKQFFQQKYFEHLIFYLQFVFILSKKAIKRMLSIFAALTHFTYLYFWRKNSFKKSTRKMLLKLTNFSSLFYLHVSRKSC